MYHPVFRIICYFQFISFKWIRDGVIQLTQLVFRLIVCGSLRNYSHEIKILSVFLIFQLNILQKA